MNDFKRNIFIDNKPAAFEIVASFIIVAIIGSLLAVLLLAYFDVLVP